MDKVFLCLYHPYLSEKGKKHINHIGVLKVAFLLGMHDIYRTDKLSTDMGENDIIFIAPINK